MYCGNSGSIATNKLRVSYNNSCRRSLRLPVVGKGGFWDNSPYTWFNYIQINHMYGWNTNIIRHPTIHVVGHNLEFTE